MSERNVLLDVLKGFAIILVVLGHSIQFTQIDNFDTNPVFKIIYSFHMPLFMFISGFVSYKTFDGSIQKLFKRFKSLVIPFWAWFVFAFFFSYLIFYLKGGAAPDFIYSLKSILKSPAYGLWFLWVLFLNYLVLFLSMKISSRWEEIFVFLFFIIANVFFYSTGYDYLGLELFCRHLLFYLAGYVINKYISNLRGLLRMVGVASLFIFPILVCFWSMKGNPTFYDYLPFNQKLKFIMVWGYKLILPFSGIFATYTLFEWLIRYNFLLKKSFIKLGQVSLEIYSTHFYFFSFVYLISFIPLGFRIITTFIITLFGTLLIQYLIKKIGFLSVIFYGKKPIPQRAV